MMRFFAVLVLASAMILSACSNAKNKIESIVYILTEEGIGNAVGTLEVESSEEGVLFRVKIQSPELQANTSHPFHVHEFADLGPATDASGNVTIGGAAGNHWDPENTGKHAGPEGDGHRGDLPSLPVNEQGEIDTEVLARRIKTVSELEGKVVIIHVTDGPDRLFGAYLK